MFELPPLKWTATRTLWPVWLAILGALPITGQVKPENCIFAGVARDQVTYLPVAKVLVRLIPGLNKRGYAGSTDVTGTFRFESVDAGDYTVDIERSGYSREPVLASEGGRPIGWLHLAAGQKLDGNELWLTPESSVQGKVLGPDGEPLADVPVTLISRKWEHGRRVYASLNRRETDDAGIYRFDAVAPGSYFVHAGKPTRGPLSFSVLDPTGKVEMRVAGRYHGGSEELSGAGRVEVRAAEDVSGIDFRLPLTPAFHVRGRTDSTTPPADTKVALYRQENGEVLDWDSETTAVGRDGGFEFSGVAPGRYFLRSVQSDQHAMLQGPKVPFTVLAGDVAGLVAPAVRRFELKGRVQVENGSRQDAETVMLTCEGREPDNLVAFWRTAGPDEDGKFVIPYLTPDWYTLRVGNAALRKGTGLYLKAVRVNGLSIQDGKMDMTAGPPSNVELIFRREAGSVEGTVVWPEKEPAGNLKVVVVEEASVAPPQMKVPDQDGHFRVIGLAPGRYRAVAVTRYEQGLWQNADFLRQAAERGTSFEAVEKETARIEVQLLPASEIRRMEDQVP